MPTRIRRVGWAGQPSHAARPHYAAISATTFAAHAWTRVGDGARAGPGGVAFAGNASTVYAWHPARIALDPPLWYAVVFDFTTSPPAGGVIAGLGANAAGGAAFAIRAFDTSGGLELFWRRTNAGTFIGYGSSAIVAPAGRLVCAVAVATGTNSADCALFANGHVINNVNGPVTLSTAGSVSAFNCVGGLLRDSFAVASPARVYAVAHGRAIGIDEARRLSANPWQLFAPRRIFVPVSSGTLIHTLSAPTYVPGSITSTGLTARVTVTAA